MSSNQQSFHLFLSPDALYQRMFRCKPYTKCIQCLSNTRLRCKKCMQQIIEDVSKNDHSKRMIRMRRFSLNKFAPNQYRYSGEKQRNQSTVLPKKKHHTENEKIAIINKYNFWMEERKKRRSEEIDFKATWPKKTRFSDANLQKIGAKQPRFERWQKKLMDQLTMKINKIT